MSWGPRTAKIEQALPAFTSTAPPHYRIVRHGPDWRVEDISTEPVSLIGTEVTLFRAQRMLRTFVFLKSSGVKGDPAAVYYNAAGEELP